MSSWVLDQHSSQGVTVQGHPRLLIRMTLRAAALLAGSAAATALSLALSTPAHAADDTPPTVLGGLTEVVTGVTDGVAGIVEDVTEPLLTPPAPKPPAPAKPSKPAPPAPKPPAEQPELPDVPVVTPLLSAVGGVLGGVGQVVGAVTAPLTTLPCPVITPDTPDADTPPAAPVLAGPDTPAAHPATPGTRTEQAAAPAKRPVAAQHPVADTSRPVAPPRTHTAIRAADHTHEANRQPHRHPVDEGCLTGEHVAATQTHQTVDAHLTSHWTQPRPDEAGTAAQPDDARSHHPRPAAPSG